MADNPCTPPRRKSDIGSCGWNCQESSQSAFSPLQRLRQGPTYQPPRRSSVHSFSTRPFEAPSGRPREDVAQSALSGSELSPQPALEQEIEGLQKALAFESRHCREHFAVRRRLYQLQNAQARGGLAAPEDQKEEAADELEKVRSALEELRRGGEEEKLHRSQLEEKVMREIEDLKSSPCSPWSPFRSLSRSNLLAEERERKRFQAGEVLHSEVQELQEALAELRVNCADEMEAQRLEEHRALADMEEMKEELGAASLREQALQAQLREVDAALRSEAHEVKRLRHDVKEQDEALASFWGLQSSYKREAAEASRYREEMSNLQEELCSLQSGENAQFMECQMERRMLHDVEIDPNEPLSASYQVASARAASALKDLPKSFQEEIGASDGPDWFAATIQKLASFATSVLKENAQLRWNAELIQARSPPSPRQAADEAGGYSDRNGSESMEEGARSTRSELHLEEAEMRQAEAEAALQLRKSECAKLAEAESKAEARLQTLEMRLADKQSQGQVSQPSHSRSQSSNRSNLTQSRLRRTSDQKKPSADSPKKLKKRSPREIKASPHTSKERGDKKSTGPTIPKLADASCRADVSDSNVLSSCLYNSDSSSNGHRGAYPPSSPDSAQPDRPYHCWTAQKRQPGSEIQESREERTEEKRELRPEAPEVASAPQSAADLFARAEALCEAQHFAEAAELFRCVLAALRANADREAMRSVEAEVWAHLGVAMQSLDDIAAAIESYCQAVRLDPSLHVCFANLATLYMYLEDFQKAEEHISKALLLEPSNQAYSDIKESVRTRSKSVVSATSRRSETRKAGRD